MHKSQLMHNYFLPTTRMVSTHLHKFITHAIGEMNNSHYSTDRLWNFGDCFCYVFVCVIHGKLHWSISGSYKIFWAVCYAHKRGNFWFSKGFYFDSFCAINKEVKRGIKFVNGYSMDQSLKRLTITTLILISLLTVTAHFPSVADQKSIQLQFF